MDLLLYGHYTKAWKLKKLYKLNPIKLPFHELVIVLSGTLHYTIDGEEVTLSDGEIAYIPQGHFCARKATSTLTDYLSINFMQEESLPFLGKFPLPADPCILHLIASADHLWKTFYPNAIPLIEPLVSYLLDYLKHLSTLVSYLLDYLKHLSTLEKKSPIVKKMEDYLLANIHKPFQLQDIADHVFLSVSHCSALFKKEMKTSIKSYYNDLRLQLAKQLLSSTEMSVPDVVSNLCYYDYNHFTRVFKKEFGVTPSQYKKSFNPKKHQ